jgi:thymidylate synthase (FAD)
MHVAFLAKILHFFLCGRQILSRYFKRIILMKEQLIGTKIQVDDGSVTLMDYMGSDLSVVNAARVSFGKKKLELDDKDLKLIKYLAHHKHMSPFRHVIFSFALEGVSEVVCRQLYKHQVGCSFTSGEFKEAATTWNEISGRYVEFEPEFHVPAEFRKQHKSNKQASTEGDCISENHAAKSLYLETIEHSYTSYKKLLEMGVCREQARMVMPICFKNSLVWTASLEAAAHFVKLRDHDGAQLEIRNLARAIKQLIDPICPYSIEALMAVEK